MAGMLIPAVLLPRFTTLAGASVFATMGMDVTEYERGILSFWRSAGIGLAAGAGSFPITFEESTDQLTWTLCGGGPYVEPGANLEAQYQPVLTKRWWRMTVTMPAAGNTVTCWCMGFLMQRES